MRKWIWGPALLLSMLLTGQCEAARITVITTLNIRPALDQLLASYERATGDQVVLESQPATPTRERIRRGDAGDVAIHSRSTLEALGATGRLQAGTLTDIAHASIGIIVRKGASHPDISTDARLRQALLSAAAITYPDPAEGSMGGKYLAALFRHWGIAATLQHRLILAGGGAAAGRLVASGRAQLGLNQTAELMRVPGIEFLTPLPPSLTRVVVMSAAVLTNAREPAAARRWIAFLASPAAAAALRADGMEP
jgi:molybdate transport system substrate-binding protein